ncbi:MAG: hypothetical protein HQK56_18510 [Deltaproteobacteria bacterium]|nr:hypothetical protein [Deltaproteobacteria bacterium]
MAMELFCVGGGEIRPATEDDIQLSLVLIQDKHGLERIYGKDWVLVLAEDKYQALQCSVEYANDEISMEKQEWNGVDFIGLCYKQLR